MLDPITMNRLALIRQQEILNLAAQGRNRPMPWARFWQWLTSRTQPVGSQALQPTGAPARMEKRDAW